MSIDYWMGMVMCHRKGGHLSHAMCLTIHNLQACGECPNFVDILEAQELEELNEIFEQERQRKLVQEHKLKRKGGRK